MTDRLLRVEEDNNLGIRLPDGTRLSARIWRPADAAGQRFPAILEYLPYRKTDGTVARDQIMHPYFAERGYVCLRVDARGCGDSEGLFEDEYSEQELQDGEDIIHWIAAQPWCDGKVGMQGISWGGFNGLQLAARNPAPLKAIITVGSTVDRFADDIHYKGGIQLSENIGWAATVLSWFSMPPDPQLVGDAWRDIWLERLEQAPFLAETWLSHPNRDAYWQHGSVCEDYSAIKAAVLSIGGLHDGYRNAMAHLLENITAPVKAIAGPWGHKYPHISPITPAIGYLQEAIRWWDHWLKDRDTGVADDPAYRAYLMDTVAPAANLDHRPGRWVTEQQWPSPNISPWPLSLGQGTLNPSEADDAQALSAAVPSALKAGANCGEYFPFGFGPGELPEDQRADDAASLCFDSANLPEAAALLGAPVIKLRVRADKARAQLVARLCDLRPDGSSNLISLGMLNLRHRNSFEHPEDLPPGELVDIEISLDQCAYHLPASHSLRLALSSSYWPYCWPEQELVNITVHSGQLILPLRAPSDHSDDEWHFEAPYSPEPRPVVRHSPLEEFKSNRYEDGQRTLHIRGDNGSSEDLLSGITTSSKLEERWQLAVDDPTSATAHIVWDRSFARSDCSVSTRVDTSMRSDKTHFHVTHVLQAWEGELLVFEKSLEASVPR